MTDFSIATFNLYNLHLPERRVYDELLYTRAQYDRKRQWVARQLQNMDADVVGVQEIWSLRALREVASASGLYLPENVHVFEREERPSVGLVSRLPILDVESIERFPSDLDVSFEGVTVEASAFSRPVIRARVQLAASLCASVFVVHLKSQRPLVRDDEDPSDPRIRTLGRARSLLVRGAEAAALRWIITRELERAPTPIVVVGDFNDGGGSVTTRLIAGEPPPDPSQEATREAWDAHLYNAHDVLRRSDHRGRQATGRRLDGLDHILLSERLTGHVSRSVAELLTVEVWDDHLNRGADQMRSDHAQLVARFRAVSPSLNKPSPT